MLAAGAILALSVVLGLRYLWKGRARRLASELVEDTAWTSPSRDSVLERLQSETFDLLVIGGGSTGVGCALDAATRGFRVALVEAGDFGSGTSSKSTKLLHGGVRYLAKAVWNLDWSQYRLVQQALSERHVIFNISPYLTNNMPILVPIYSKLLVPYYFVGLKLYDWLSGFRSLGRSYFISREQAVEAFPHVLQKSLCGAMVYHDGQHNDVRNNVMLAVTAAYHGAAVANHVPVESLIVEEGRAVGAVCTDRVTGRKMEVRAAGVINSTGCFADTVRRMDSSAESIMVQSSGTHIVIPRKYTPKTMGFLDPHTGDGRIAFFLPWMGKTLVGTTDKKSSLDFNPCPTQTDLDFLIHEVRTCTSGFSELARDEVSAIWTGIRPLVKNPGASKTEAIVRRHFIGVDENGLLTVAGGKWTTYRKMAEEAVDKAVDVFSLKHGGPCVTKYVRIVGSHGYSRSIHQEIRHRLGVSKETAMHLARSYGARAFRISEYVGVGEKKIRLSRRYPYLVAEVAYCIDNEMAVKVCDVLCNRLVLGLVDVKEARRCIGAVLEVFREKCGWDEDRCRREEAEAAALLNSYGLAILNE